MGALSQNPLGLLVVLAIEEARNVDRLALEPRLSVVLTLLIELRLRSAARGVGHPFEQGPAAACGRGLYLVRVVARRDRRGSDRAGQNVIRAEEQLLVAFLRRRVGGQLFV